MQIAIGVSFAALAGICVAVQGVFNSHVAAKAGLWGTVLFVHALGFTIALTIFLMTGGKLSHMMRLTQVNPLYLIGGVLGVIIVYSVPRGIPLTGVALFMIVMLIVQLSCSVAIDSFGLFDMPALGHEWHKMIGIAIMVVGMLVFSLGRRLF